MYFSCFFFPFFSPILINLVVEAHYMCHMLEGCVAGMSLLCAYVDERDRFSIYTAPISSHLSTLSYIIPAYKSHRFASLFLSCLYTVYYLRVIYFTCEKKEEKNEKKIDKKYESRGYFNSLRLVVITCFLFFIGLRPPMMHQAASFNTRTRVILYFFFAEFWLIKMSLNGFVCCAVSFDGPRNSRNRRISGIRPEVLLF